MIHFVVGDQEQEFTKCHHLNFLEITVLNHTICPLNNMVKNVFNSINTTAYT